MTNQKVLICDCLEIAGDSKFVEPLLHDNYYMFNICHANEPLLHDADLMSVSL